MEELPQQSLKLFLPIAVEDVEAAHPPDIIRYFVPRNHGVKEFPRLVANVGIEFTGELSHHFERGCPSQQMMRFMRALHQAWPYSGAYIGCIHWFSLLYLSHARAAQVVYRAGEDESFVSISLKDAILLQATLATGINTLARQVKLKADDKRALHHRLNQITTWVTASAPMSLPP